MNITLETHVHPHMTTNASAPMLHIKILLILKLQNLQSRHNIIQNLTTMHQSTNTYGIQHFQCSKLMWGQN
jgi:hypothetical protein